MVPARFELSTPCLRGQNSTTELRLSQEFRAKKLVASWNNSDWQFLKWIAGTLVKSQFWFFNSFCSTIFVLTNSIYIISTGSRLVEINLHPFSDGAFIITFLHLHWKFWARYICEVWHNVFPQKILRIFHCIQCFIFWMKCPFLKIFN